MKFKQESSYFSYILFWKTEKKNFGDAKHYSILIQESLADSFCHFIQKGHFNKCHRLAIRLINGILSLYSQAVSYKAGYF